MECLDTILNIYKKWASVIERHVSLDKLTHSESVFLASAKSNNAKDLAFYKTYVRILMNHLSEGQLTPDDFQSFQTAKNIADALIAAKEARLIELQAELCFISGGVPIKTLHEIS